ncbi:MAG: 16S rRNA (adenine(1518)-N(6)/adenine(1519)-N(6))-dimethyltransferase RsmA [Candidatus Micrarchaeaceae archaeon]|nr:16S rRNA (adenine(1518)-N(6)/adenine(1519)-N(6))-dimethyltransferase RsmA [Candidatus Marsarchaeota archaeon]
MTDYKQLFKKLRINKKLGQNFLINKHIAEFEANFGKNKNVIEIGSGLGILTQELINSAKKIMSIEKDENLYKLLKNEFNDKYKNLVLINKDIFEINDTELKNFDIIISNIPYNISSKILTLLAKLKLDAVMCLQKEFVEHMTAKPGTKKYSKLSVFSYLQFNIDILKQINANNFYPKPKINSTIIYLKFKKNIDENKLKLISLLMMHKKKKLRNAFFNSIKNLNISKEKAEQIIENCQYKDEKVFKIDPDQLMNIAEFIENRLSSTKYNFT